MKKALLFLWITFFLALAQNQGASLYQARCAVCHGVEGQGTPGLYPPLAGSLGRLLALKEARAYVAWVVRYGLQGPIRSGGMVYQGVMPAHPSLTPEEEAALLNYLLALNTRHLSSNYPPFTPEEVKGYQAQAKTPAELRRLREALLQQLSAKGLPMP
jgi:mono/diheme cytochrome c family protein